MPRPWTSQTTAATAPAGPRPPKLGDEPDSVSTGADSDELLTERVRAGDQEAVAELYRRHHPAVLAYARSCATTAQAAEDLAGEAFAATLATVRTGLGPMHSWRRYLQTVVRNTAIAWTADQRRTQLTPDFSTWADAHEHVPSPDDFLTAAAERDLAARAYLALPERWQTVLWHCTVEQRPPEAVAAILGLSPSGVSSLLLRAREGLREAYLAAHLTTAAPPECRALASRLTALARRPDQHRPKILTRHLDQCARCRAGLGEVQEVNARLRTAALSVLLPASAHRHLAALLDSAPSTSGHLAAATGGPALKVAVGIGLTAVLATCATLLAPSAPGDAPTGTPARETSVTPVAGAGPTTGAGPTSGAVATAVATAGVAVGTPTGAGAPSEPANAAALTAPPGPAAPQDPASRGPAPSPVGAGPSTSRPAGSGKLSAGVYSPPDETDDAPGELDVHLRHTASGTCADAAGHKATDGATPVLAPCTSSPTQRWYLKPATSEGSYYLVSASNEGCLDGAGSTPAVRLCNGSVAQEWQTASMPGGATALKNRASGRFTGRGAGAPGLLGLQPAACATDPACQATIGFSL
ncbi:sigma-70 family RNA polymerase sigma factor [Kitasatospora sp. NPDC088346]|uniref:sigma-70 family RNA polymerase sigma factor n=1 Tax=Kitasatospora sp. NPDC088346 TaxID=3364073 RepID=UPI0038093C97